MKKIFIIYLLILASSTYSQDPSFTMSSENLNYVNPAFTGTSKNIKTGLSYRNQWPGISGNYVTTNVYFDKYLGKFGGVGVTYIHDLAANTLKTDIVYLDYAYKVNIKENGVLSLGVELGYFQKSLDWDKLTFGDMIDPRRGFVYPTSSPYYKENISNLDFGGGLLFYNKQYFISYGLHHINRPNTSLTYSEIPLSMLHTLFFGGWIKLNDKFSLSPQLDVKMQGNYTNAAAWLKVDYTALQIGVGYRSRDAILATLGVNLKRFRINYSYDYTVSKLGISVGGSHEIGFQLFLNVLKNSNDRALLVY